MKLFARVRAAVFLAMAASMVLSVINPAVAAESDLSPFYGLIFDEPDSSTVNDSEFSVRRIFNTGVNTGAQGYHMVEWGSYTSQADPIGAIVLFYKMDPDLTPFIYDMYKEGQFGIIEKGPKETLVGLPAFYTITETKVSDMPIPNVNDITNRTITWYIVCEDRYFEITNTALNLFSEPKQHYLEQHNQVFENFLSSLKTTGELKPGSLGGDSGDGDSGDGSPGGASSSGGCNAGYGLFGLLLTTLAAGKYRKA
jgi:hypothetical protein